MDKAGSTALKDFFKSVLWGITIASIFSLAFVLFFKYSSYNLVNVDGPSMEPTFTNGDLLVIKDEEIKRNDIAVFHPPEPWREVINPGATNLIKRVVGLPGDTLRYEGLQLTIESTEGKKYAIQEAHPESCALQIGETMKLPANQYFLAGDNRAVSFDSLAAWCKGLDPRVDKKLLGTVGEVKIRLESLGGQND